MKKGHFDSKKGGNVLFFFQKTETKSWGLPLMNGGLKTNLPMLGFIKTDQIGSSNSIHPALHHPLPARLKSQFWFLQFASQF